MTKEDEQTQTAERPTAPRAAKDRSRAYLTIIHGVNVGEMRAIDRPNIILGRGADADLRLSDDGVSREHAVVETLVTGFTVKDLGSRNGTLVNGERIAAVRQLEDGDQLQLGETVVKFSYHDAVDHQFHQLMIESAVRDSLTGTYNRKHFADRLESEFAYAARHKEPFSVIVVDIDHFKKVNDTHGHVVGDAVLRALAMRLLAGVRTEDVLCRCGGEEFAVLCRGTTPSRAMQLAERLRGSIADHVITHNNLSLHVSVSIGVAGLPDHPVASAMQLYGVADQALYAAKEGGRNLVKLGVFEPPPADTNNS